MQFIILSGYHSLANLKINVNWLRDSFKPNCSDIDNLSLLSLFLLLHTNTGVE